MKTVALGFTLLGMSTHFISMFFNNREEWEKAQRLQLLTTVFFLAASVVLLGGIVSE